jgi:hypothetical protein
MNIVNVQSLTSKVKGNEYDQICSKLHLNMFATTPPPPRLLEEGQLFIF